MFSNLDPMLRDENTVQTVHTVLYRFVMGLLCSPPIVCSISLTDSYSAPLSLSLTFCLSPSLALSPSRPLAVNYGAATITANCLDEKEAVPHFALSCVCLWPSVGLVTEQLLIIFAALIWAGNRRKMSCCVLVVYREFCSPTGRKIANF